MGWNRDCLNEMFHSGEIKKFVCHFSLTKLGNNCTANGMYSKAYMCTTASKKYISSEKKYVYDVSRRIKVGEEWKSPAG